MNKQKFTEFREELGLTMNFGSAVVGYACGWPVSVMLLYGNPRVFLDAEKNHDSAAKKQVKKAVKGLASFTFRSDGGIVADLKLKKNGPTAAECTLAVLNALNENGFAPKGTCPICNQSGCDCVSVTPKKGYRLTHRACLQKTADTAAEKAERNESRGNYFTGFLGALLGMMVGCIPSLLTIWFMDRIYALLFALIPLAAYYGCKLLGGRMNKAALAVSVLMSILGVYFINMTYITIYYTAAYGLSFTEAVNVFTLLLADASAWSEITASSIMYFVFSLIGVALVWRLISQTSGGNAEAARSALENAVMLSTEGSSDTAYPAYTANPEF